MKYKAIIFDNAGVVIDESHRRWAQKIAERFRQPFDLIYQNYSRGEAWQLYKRGLINEDTFWERGNKAANLNLDINCMRQIVRESRIPIAGMDTIIKKLHINYLLALMNNEGKEWDEYSKKRHSFYQLFTLMISSHAHGVVKPEPEIYQILADKLQEFGIKPSECIYIDDKAANLVPADKLGIRTVLFSEIKSFRKELMRLGL
ncbi:HAD family phosphatase [Patescibacteria group bacterium]|nr:HAD family phosphatase [Patescibacteria group bacterium]MBU1075467.1 HAD family phosphatase [Patescibacteria group bacterium]MBU1951572.1 HAD family phosphatase [Patescibacteria group bacterium]MBU2229190.1 HAD family phosphatase [Patescibacteria group bacterium]